MKIGLISDTHGYIHPRIEHHFKDCDEIWHAGDIGSLDSFNQLAALKPVRAVYGNIDGADIRTLTKEDLVFKVDGLIILMTHIAGYPGHYNARVKKLINLHKPGLVICGHSHILKVIYDQSLHHLHINPGAAGNHGWHKVMTVITFEIVNSAPSNLKVIELGPRGKLVDSEQMADH